MKILLVSNFADCGGVESAIREIANLYTKEHEVHFLYFDGECNIDFDDKVKIHFIDNHNIVKKPSFLPKREIGRFFGRKHLMEKLLDITPDIVIAFKPFVGVAIAKLKKYFNFKLIVSLHGNYTSDTKNYNIKKLINDFKNIDILTVLTNNDKKYYEQYFNCIIKVMPNPANLPNIDIKKENIVCCIGRVDNDKRTDLFIKAVALCQDKFRDYRFVVAGGGSELENMKKLSKDLNARVEFFGKLSQMDTYKLYAKSKVCVVCSESEGWCLVLQEAMYYECIRISTKYHGESIDILINNGHDGYVTTFEPLDIACVLDMVLSQKDDEMIKLIEAAKIKYDLLCNDINAKWISLVQGN